MSAVAVWSDAAELKQRAAVVERARDRPSMFEGATEAVRSMVAAVSHWDRLDNTTRDILRHLARSLAGTNAKPNWFARQRTAFQVIVLFSRQGVDETIKQIHAFQAAQFEFISKVFAADERQNPELQAMLTDAIKAATDSSEPRTVVRSKGELSEWFKQLPS